MQHLIDKWREEIKTKQANRRSSWIDGINGRFLSEKVDELEQALSEQQPDIQWLIKTMEWLSAESSNGGMTTCSDHRGYGFKTDCTVCSQFEKLKKNLQWIKTQ